jgi:hypothetical protein
LSESGDTSLLVTLGGECLAVSFQGKQAAADRDGVFYLFHVTDMAEKRGKRLVSVCRFGPKSFYPPDYDARLAETRLNVIRRAFDLGKLAFDGSNDDHHYQELWLEAADFAKQEAVTDETLREFILHKSYWAGFRYSEDTHRHFVSFEEVVDLDYLGIGREEMRRNVWFLGQQGFLDKTEMPGLARPTAKVVEFYEARRKAPPTEKVFPEGTQYEAFKAISGIFRSAKEEILIADNYLSDEVLDMLIALPLKPALRLLTHKPKADFRVAVRRFTLEYGRPVKARIHSAEIHDRAIAIDGREFYVLGGSIKDAGNKLTLINRLQESAACKTLQATLEGSWNSAREL